MKILLISDGHGAIENLRTLKSVAKNVDMLLFAGDFAAFNQPKTGYAFLEELIKIHKNIYAVLGNCDEPSFIEELKKTNINIQGTVQYFDDFAIIGSGGASKFTGATPNERSDEDLANDIEKAYVRKEGESLIIVTHNPPHGLKIDKVAPLVHVGSKLIRRFIEQNQPILVVSGHIHEAYGEDYISSTLTVNPGALCDGRYAIAELEKLDGKYKVSLQLKTI